MTFSTLPPIEDFTTDFTEQQTFFNNLQTVINEICATRPITIRKSTRPTESDFLSAWLAANPSGAIPVPPEQQFIWFDTSLNKVGGVFQTALDIFTNSYLLVQQTGIAPDYHSSGRLAYQAQIGGSEQCITVSDMNLNYTILRSPDGTNRRCPNWNDAGTQLVFITNETTGNRHIAKMNADGTGVTALTVGGVGINEDTPNWVGSSITYAKLVGIRSEIFKMTDAGASQTQLTFTGVGDRTQPAYSPSGTRIAYINTVGGNRQLWMMNSNGTSQAAVTAIGGGIDSSAPGVAWSADENWIYFGKYRVHPNGTGLEVWFTMPSYPSATTLDSAWYKQVLSNLSTDIPNGICLGPGDKVVIGNWQSGGTFGLSSALIAWAIVNDGNDSTGKFYRTSQYVNPSGNIRLLKDVVFDGTTSNTLLNSNELPADIEHVLILVDGSGTANVAPNNMLLTFNGDAAAANYMTVYERANAVTLNRVEVLPTVSQGIVVLMPGNQTATTSHGSFAIWVTAIRSTDNLKQVVFEGGEAITALSATTAMNEITGVGIWNSTDAIRSIGVALVGALGNFRNGSRISFYGFPKDARWAI